MIGRAGTHMLVLAKAPLAGRVKTRLCPPLSPAEAAEIAGAALADTLESVVRCRADHKIVALEGPPGDWLPERMHVVPQRGAGLDERLAHAWAATADISGGWGAQIGMDTPQVSADELDAVLDLVDAAPNAAVLGHAVDGGWWTIGLRGADPRRVFIGVPMSTPRTGQAQAARLRALGLDVRLAPAQRDIDTAADLAAVATTTPDSRTAAAWRRCLDTTAAKAS